ncbi:hypothetical protein V9T40_009847 [Parthenolecanium corni]|uniref:Uncharacterized protein n=1 Tax=Parthenolecanium corni TaxID=536013 RepID=A0AAN9Y6T9_9HEMI
MQSPKPTGESRSSIEAKINSTWQQLRQSSSCLNENILKIISSQEIDAHHHHQANTAGQCRTNIKKEEWEKRVLLVETLGLLLINEIRIQNVVVEKEYPARADYAERIGYSSQGVLGSSVLPHQSTFDSTSSSSSSPLYTQPDFRHPVSSHLAARIHPFNATCETRFVANQIRRRNRSTAPIVSPSVNERRS